MAKDSTPRITATPVKPLGEQRMADREAAAAPRAAFDLELAAQIAAAQQSDPEAAAAALDHVSADIDPLGLRSMMDAEIEIPAAQPNPDDDGRAAIEADARATEAQRQAAIRKQAIVEHQREIDADANHPLRGAMSRSRLPFGSRSARLSAPARPGFHRHWFNAVPDRIERALRAGYKIVNDVDGKPMKRVVGREEKGDALYAFYMEIPIDWYVQDMRAARKTADDLEEAIKGGKLGMPTKGYQPLAQGVEYEAEVGGDYRPRA